MPCPSIFSLVLSNAPTISPSGGPSLINRSKDSASAAIGLLLEIGRLPAAPNVGGIMFVASLFDLPRECWVEDVFGGVCARWIACLCCCVMRDGWLLFDWPSECAD
jgi:hypothetical protein